MTIEGSVNDSLAIDDVPIGGLATVRVLIKTPPQSSADWTFRADVGYDPDISICNVHIQRYGYALPCLNESTPSRSIGRTGLQGYETGWLDLYKLSNVGQSLLMVLTYLLMVLISSASLFEYRQPIFSYVMLHSRFSSFCVPYHTVK